MKIAFTTDMENIISTMIRKATEYQATIFPVASHCLPIIGNLHEMELGLSADELTISIIDMNRYRTNRNCVLRIYEIPDIVEPSIWIRKIVTEHNEKIYPHLELIYFIWQWAKDQILPDDPTDKNWIDYSEICSELTFHALQGAGYSGWIKKYDANSISPTVLETLVASIPNCRLIEERNYEQR
jgi:hypothetical protein